MSVMARRFQLMAHQVEGIEFLLSRKSGVLAFEQGLGKTLVAIEAFARLRAAGLADTLVVVCPNSLKRNWASEIDQAHPQLRVTLVGGPPKIRRAALSDEQPDVYLINYESARNEIAALRALMGRTRTVLVLDESHYVKNVRSLNSLAASHLAPLTEYRWLLSGTPVPNSPADLYPQLRTVAGPEAVGSFDGFMARYGNAASEQRQRETLGERIGLHLLRRTKEQCLDLPGKSFVDVEVQLPRWQRELYNGIRDGILREVSGMSREEFDRFRPVAMTRLLRLAQVASNPRLIFPKEIRIGGKILELDRIVEELVARNHRKVIVWSHFVETVRMLTERYQGFGAECLYGETPVADRHDLVSRFQDNPAFKVLVANPAAAGTGFTLTAAHYSVYETLNWRYDLYAQSQDRNHRIGQRNPVTYLRLLAADTVDHAVAESLARKASVAKELLGDDLGQAMLVNMTPEAFCEMVKTGRLPV